MTPSIPPVSGPSTAENPTPGPGPRLATRLPLDPPDGASAPPPAGPAASTVPALRSDGKEPAAPARKPTTSGKIPHVHWPEIRRRVASGERKQDLAREFGVHERAIYHICKVPAAHVTRMTGIAEAPLPDPPVQGGPVISRDHWPEIRRRVAEGEFKTTLAAEYGVSPRNIYAIIRRLDREEGVETVALSRSAGAAQRKIPPERRPDICRRVAAGERKATIALEFGVTERAIFSIVRKAEEAHLGPEERRVLREARRRTHLDRLRLAAGRRSSETSQTLDPWRPLLEAIKTLERGGEGAPGAPTPGPIPEASDMRPGRARVGRIFDEFRTSPLDLQSPGRRRGARELEAPSPGTAQSTRATALRHFVEAARALALASLAHAPGPHQPLGQIGPLVVQLKRALANLELELGLDFEANLSNDA